MTTATLTEFRSGDILFREGDASDRVLRLVSGVVEIQREVGGQPIILGHVGEGEFIGEMGAIENRPHLATARAETDGVVEVLSVDGFFERISSDADAAYELILRLSSRLRAADDALVYQSAPRATPAAPVRQEAAPAVTIAADSAALQAQIGATAIAVSERPFVVGRQLDAGEDWPEFTPQLLVQDRRPHLMSRNHFMIDCRPGHIILRDLNSVLGTSVNGQPLGRHFAKDSAPLQAGDNVVVAGGRGSKFQFRVTVS